MRQQSIDSIDILNDASLVSIQDSVQTTSISNSSRKPDNEIQPVFPDENNSFDLINSSKNPVIQVIEEAKKPIDNIRLEDLCNPNKFTLDFNEETSKRRQKITKNDFLKAGSSSSSQEKSSDPFFSLDPLRKQ